MTNVTKIRNREAYVIKAHENHDERRKSRATGVVRHKSSRQAQRTSLQLENGRRVSKKPTSATTNVKKMRKRALYMTKVHKNHDEHRKS